MKIRRIVSLFLALMMIMAVCAVAEEEKTGILELSKGGAYVGEAAEPVSLTVCNSTKVNGMFFTRQFGNNTSDIDVRAMIHGYNPIVWDTQLTYILDPQVVKDMTKSTDADGDTVYTFTVYDDLKWNDGSEMTAADWVFGYVLQTSAEFEALGGDTDTWLHLKGYEEFVSGESEVLSGIHLLGDYSFSVTVKKEYLPYFYELSYLYVMPSPISIIAPGCEVADEGDGAFIRNIDPEVEKPIFTEKLLRKTILDANKGYLSHPELTCGPYSLVSYDKKSGKVEFTINEYYKGNYQGQKPTITNVTLIPALPQDMAAMLENGEVDLINKAVDDDTIDACLTLPGTAHEDYPRLGYGFIGFACEQGPQQFEAVRQAIAYAFDTETFVNDLVGDYGVEVYGYYGIGQWMYLATQGGFYPKNASEELKAEWDSLTLDSLNHYTMNANKALQLLVDDGWTLNAYGRDYDPERDTLRYKKLEGGKLMPLKLTFGLCKDNLAAQEVYDILSENLTPLGFKLDVRTVEFTDLLTDYMHEKGTHKYDILFMAHNLLSVYDPYVEMSGSQNPTYLYDEELIERAWDMHKTPQGDLTTYLTRWIKFQERYNEILPTVPLYSDTYYDFHTDRLMNYWPDAEANWPRAILYAYLTAEAEEVEE